MMANKSTCTGYQHSFLRTHFQGSSPWANCGINFRKLQGELLPAVFLTSYLLTKPFLLSKSVNGKKSVRPRFCLLLGMERASHARHSRVAFDIAIPPQQRQRSETINQHHHLIEHSPATVQEGISESLQPSRLSRIAAVGLAILRTCA